MSHGSGAVCEYMCAMRMYMSYEKIVAHEIEFAKIKQKFTEINSQWKKENNIP